jgi:mono/diheme cytochrome c family protein
MKRATLVPAALISMFVLAGAARAQDPAAQKVDFVKDVQPIFKASCVKCHGVNQEEPKKKAASLLWLDDKKAAMKGGKSGVDIIPGNAKDSLLFKLLAGPVMVHVEDDDKQVPPMPKVKKGQTWKPLSDQQVATIKLWIDQGANWPDAAH